MFRPGRENGIPAEPENLVFARRFKNASGIGMAGIFTLRRWLALPLAASRLPEAESRAVSYFRVSGVGSPQRHGFKHSYPRSSAFIRG
jgi:hypothetical protein